ncbi:TM2 domain-containing protein [Entomospira nematocerorum]|uniref:TM2 domain-containing protein n=1 Tax=Entomospira nematocerorum TaxID=2719987 RepID=A0A968GFA3_9SPIO|nr:TM2 domain-containing protein [Entomospira nematocera]NIZ47215.1 TM2 domain-containing protein [Entomospira nematocera]WDI34242.1 TM2 domain-containing protein [Entomospira nematocera]
MASTERVSEHSRLIALILCIFTGYLGFHRIFTGYRSIGIIQMLVSVTSLALAFFVYFMNREMFNALRVSAYSLQRYLLTMGLIAAMLIPFFIILAWACVDGVRIALNRYDDADGHRVSLWLVHSAL